jgi:hypothetical protein
MQQLPIRKLKKSVFELLQGADFDAALEKILLLPPRRAVNPLFSFFYHTNPLIRWRAVTAVGAVTALLADSEIESARVVFRRLMWNLNDESGGIGWGSPEAMGEILFRHRKMRDEYLSIFLSYLRPGGNYLEHEGLQQGLLWGAGRIAHGSPEPIRQAASLVQAHLDAANPRLRGTAAWTCGVMTDRTAADRLRALEGDRAGFELWIDQNLRFTTVGDTARLALEKIEGA